MIVLDSDDRVMINTHRGICSTEDRLTTIYTNIAFDILGSIGEKLNRLHVDAIHRTVKEQIGPRAGR